MKQYINKSQVIQAILFLYTPEGIQELKDFLGTELISYGKDRHPHAMAWAEIGVIEQNHNLTPPAKHIASEGDYIIKDSSGEFKVCKPDVFEENYTEFYQDDK